MKNVQFVQLTSGTPHERRHRREGEGMKKLLNKLLNLSFLASKKDLRKLRLTIECKLFELQARQDAYDLIKAEAKETIRRIVEYKQYILDDYRQVRDAIFNEFGIIVCVKIDGVKKSRLENDGWDIKFESDKYYYFAPPAEQQNKQPRKTKSGLRMINGLQLKLTRARKGISQAKLAKKMGCSPPTISRIENGRLAISQEMIDQLAQCLKVDTKKFDYEGEE